MVIIDDTLYYSVVYHTNYHTNKQTSLSYGRLAEVLIFPKKVTKFRKYMSIKWRGINED